MRSTVEKEGEAEAALQWERPLTPCCVPPSTALCLPPSCSASLAFLFWGLTHCWPVPLHWSLVVTEVHHTDPAPLYPCSQ